MCVWGAEQLIERHPFFLPNAQSATISWMDCAFLYAESGSTAISNTENQSIYERSRGKTPSETGAQAPSELRECAKRIKSIHAYWLLEAVYESFGFGSGAGSTRSVLS